MQGLWSHNETKVKLISKPTFRRLKTYNLNLVMDKSTINQLSKSLRNVGPRLAERLLAVGIDSADKLREIGAKGAFEKMYKDGDKYGDYNAAYLYALEGAIRDCDWLDIPEKTKLEYKDYAKMLQKTKKMRCRTDITNLQDIPNVGPATIRYLKIVGVNVPLELVGKNPYSMFEDLCHESSKQFDPCLLDVFISAVRFMEGAPEKEWWQYTAERKEYLAKKTTKI